MQRIIFLWTIWMLSSETFFLLMVILDFIFTAKPIFTLWFLEHSITSMLIASFPAFWIARRFQNAGNQ